jgi:hypothetical protein
MHSVGYSSKFFQYRLRRRAALALVLRAEPRRAVRVLGRLGHLHERELADLHPG